MVLSLQAFTTASNTLVIADTAAVPGTLPRPAVSTPVAQPEIDADGRYIWTPNNVPNQQLTLQSSFRINIRALSTALPVSVYYLFAGSGNVTVTSANIQVLNAQGAILATVPLTTLTGNNGNNPNNVGTLAADSLLGVQLQASFLLVNITATATAPATGIGRYLGEVIVREAI